MPSISYSHPARQLQPGDHVCFIYQNDEEHDSMLSAFVAEGVARHEKVLYLYWDRNREEFLRSLRAAGVAVDAQLDAGQFCFVDAAQIYLEGGSFVPERMINRLREEIAAVVRQGYSGLRVTGEMSWVLQRPPGHERLLEYERKVDAALAGARCTALCQYDRRKFKPNVLVEVLETHPKAAVSGELCEDNPYYLPGRETPATGTSEARLDHWLTTLHRCSEKTPRQSSPATRRSEPLCEADSELLETLCEAVVVAQDDVFKFTNPATSDLTGYSQAELLARPFLELVHPEDRKTALENYLSVLQCQRKFSGVLLRIVTRQGAHKWVEANARAITWDHKPAVLACLTDVTRAMRAKLDRIASEAQMRSVIEASPIGIRIAQHGKYVYANPAFLKIFGYDSAKDILGLPVEQLYHDKERPLIRRRQQERLAGKTVPSHYESVGLHKDGTPFPIDIWVTLIDYGGEPGILAFILDKSEENKLRDQLLHAQKMQALGEMAGGIAHDFNNLLAVIIGYTELLGHVAEGRADAADYIKEIAKASKRAKAVVQSILNFSRKEEGRMEPVDLSDLLQELGNFLRVGLPANIRVQLQVEDPNNTILANSDRINQVFLNLCNNAADVMQDGGLLTINLRQVEFTEQQGATPERAGRFVLATVSDTGPGMPPQVLERLFDPYFTTKEKGLGTGLGLAIVDTIVKNHRGWIEVESREGEGTTFKVYFPLSQQRRRAEKPALAEIVSGKERILLIDDEPSVRDLTVKLLERLGYSVTAVAGGREALELFRQDPHRFDLVITDLSMPEIAGDRLAAELIKLRADIPVILYTGYVEDSCADAAAKIGIKAILSKPFSAADLAKTMRSVLTAK